MALNDGLGTMLVDGHPLDLINKLLFDDVLHGFVPQWICPVVKILCKSLLSLVVRRPENSYLRIDSWVAHTCYLELGWRNVL
jgi:hypothetical protein